MTYKIIWAQSAVKAVMAIQCKNIHDLKNDNPLGEDWK